MQSARCTRALPRMQLLALRSNRPPKSCSVRAFWRVPSRRRRLCECNSRGRAGWNSISMVLLTYMLYICHHPCCFRSSPPFDERFVVCSAGSPTYARPLTASPARHLEVVSYLPIWLVWIATSTLCWLGWHQSNTRVESPNHTNGCFLNSAAVCGAGCSVERQRNSNSSRRARAVLFFWLRAAMTSPGPLAGVVSSEVIACSLWSCICTRMYFGCTRFNVLTWGGVLFFM